MSANLNKNKMTMTRWYNDMWGRCDSSKVQFCIAPEYLRHDLTGANNIVTVESYSRTVDRHVASKWIKDFKYIAIVEGDFIGTMARYLIGDELQWDWVQLFRTENNLLAETWLPGLGGNDARSIPTPVTAWCGSEVPSQELLPMTDSKALVKAWYEALAAGQDATELLARSVRNHDITTADATLEAGAFQQHWRGLMQHDNADDLKLFLMQEGDMVFAVGMWSVGADKREWNWVQAFRIDAGRIAETWLPSIGGTDASLTQTTDNCWALDVIPDNGVHIGRDIGFPEPQPLPAG